MPFELPYGYVCAVERGLPGRAAFRRSAAGGGRGRRLQLHDACTFRGFRLTLP